MPKPKKKKRLLRVFTTLLGLLFIFLGSLYFLLQSPRFLLFVVKQVNHAISGEILYDSLSIDIKARRLDLKGFVYQTEEGRPMVILQSLGLDFSLSGALLGHFNIENMRAQGLVIDQKASKPSLTPSSWRSVLRLILKRVSVKDGIVDSIDIHLRNGDQYHLEQTHIDLSPQMLQKQNIKIGVQQTLLKPGGLEISSGAFAFEGGVKIPVLRDFTFFVSEAKGKLKLQDVTIGKLPANSLEGEFKIGGDSIYLMNALLKHPDGNFQINLDYTPKDKAYQVDVKTMQPFPVKSIPKVPERVASNFRSFELDLKASLKNFKLAELSGKVAVQLKTQGNKVNPDNPEQNVKFSGQLDKGALKLDSFRLTSTKSQVDAKGQIDFAKQKFDISATTKKFDLATLIDCITDLSLSGYVDAEGTIKGDFKSPEFAFKGHSYEVGYSFLRFGEHFGSFKIENGDLSYEGNSPPGASDVKKVFVLSKRIYSSQKETTLKAEFDQIGVDLLTDSPLLKGKAKGTFDLNTSWNTDTQAKLVAKIDDFWVSDFHLGELNAEAKLGQRKFVVNPVTFQPPNFEKITLPAELIFAFDDQKVTVNGVAFPGAPVSGQYLYSNPNVFNLESNFKNLDVRPLMAMLEWTPVEAYGDGKIKMAMGLNKTPSKIDIDLSRFELPLEEGSVREAEPISITIIPPKITFNRARFRSGQGHFALQGSYMMEGNSDLSLKGKLDLTLLKLLPEYFREGSGFANLDIHLAGNKLDPKLNGEISFDPDAELVLRALRGTFENIGGKIVLNGNYLKLDKLKSSLDEGEVIIDGVIGIKDLSPSYYDLTLEAREASIAESGVYKLVFSGDFTLKGPADNATLAGNMFITDGRYSRDFDIAEFILKPTPKTLPEEPSDFMKHLNLDLNIKNSGELAIKNNIARMFLQSDLQVKGPALKPKVLGAMEVLEGKFNYFRINFDNAKGVVDFRNQNRAYVDITASKEFAQQLSTINVVVHIQGYLDNLQINFTSDSGLEKRDILALVFTGSLPGEGGEITSTKLASSIVASQLSGILQNTIGTWSQLDIIRLEGGAGETRNLSTLIVGKQLTERLSLEFKTDLGVDDPLQGVQMEYLLLDNALLKASQLSNGSFNMNFTLRWKTF